MSSEEKPDKALESNEQIKVDEEDEYFKRLAMERRRLEQENERRRKQLDDLLEKELKVKSAAENGDLLNETEKYKEELNLESDDILNAIGERSDGEYKSDNEQDLYAGTNHDEVINYYQPVPINHYQPRSYYLRPQYEFRPRGYSRPYIPRISSWQPYNQFPNPVIPYQNVASVLENSSKLDYLFTDAKYFLIKSANHENVALAMAKGIWSCLPPTELKINTAFKLHSNVIIVFSVKESGKFQGYARIAAESNHNHPPIRWVLPEGVPPHMLSGVFAIDWVSRQELSFEKISHIRNELNEGISVKIGRDGQELCSESGESLCRNFPKDTKIDLRVIAQKAKRSLKHRGLKVIKREKSKKIEPPVDAPNTSGSYYIPNTVYRPRGRYPRPFRPYPRGGYPFRPYYQPYYGAESILEHNYPFNFSEESETTDNNVPGFMKHEYEKNIALKEIRNSKSKDKVTRRRSHSRSEESFTSSVSNKMQRKNSDSKEKKKLGRTPSESDRSSVGSRIHSHSQSHSQSRSSSKNQNMSKNVRSGVPTTPKSDSDTNISKNVGQALTPKYSHSRSRSPSVTNSNINISQKEKASSSHAHFRSGSRTEMRSKGKISNRNNLITMKDFGNSRSRSQSELRFNEKNNSDIDEAKSPKAFSRSRSNSRLYLNERNSRNNVLTKSRALIHSSSNSKSTNDQIQEHYKNLMETKSHRISTASHKHISHSGRSFSRRDMGNNGGRSLSRRDVSHRGRSPGHNDKSDKIEQINRKYISRGGTSERHYREKKYIRDSNRDDIRSVKKRSRSPHSLSRHYKKSSINENTETRTIKMRSHEDEMKKQRERRTRKSSRSDAIIRIFKKLN